VEEEEEEKKKKLRLVMVGLTFEIGRIKSYEMALCGDWLGMSERDGRVWWQVIQ